MDIRKKNKRGDLPGTKVCAVMNNEGCVGCLMWLRGM